MATLVHEMVKLGVMFINLNTIVVDYSKIMHGKKFLEGMEYEYAYLKWALVDKYFQILSRKHALVDKIKSFTS